MQQYHTRNRQSTNYDQILTNGKRSYNYSNMQKSIQLSQTDKRIQQIKKKYDTPNRKQRISQLSVKKQYNKENQNYSTADFKNKFNVINTHTEANQSTLKESKAINNSRQNFFNNPSSGSKSFIANNILRQKQSLDYKLSSNKLYANQNQQQFFKRVKQMKQSLLYGADNTSKQNQMKGSTFYPTKQSRAKTGMYDSNQPIEKDRIDNIDKINQKIKGILQCLNQNEKTRVPSRFDGAKRSHLEMPLVDKESNYNNRDLVRTPVKNVVTSSIIGRESFGNHRHERSQILDKIQINKEYKDRDFKDDSKREAKQKNDQKWQKLSSKLQKYELQNKLRFQKAYDFSKEMQKDVPSTQNVVQNIRKERYGVIANNDPKKSIQVVRRDNRSMDLKDFRSRSFLNNQPTGLRDVRDRSLHTRQLTETKDYAMKSGKKLDDQIDRIQKKIQQFQQDKKRMGVNFKPFNYSNTKSTSNLGYTNSKNDYSERKVSDFNRNLTKNQITSSYLQSKELNKNNQFDKTDQDQTFRQKRDYAFQDRQRNQENSFNRLDSKIEIKLEKSNPSSVRTSKFISQSSSRIGNQRQDEIFVPQSRRPVQQKSYKIQNQKDYFFDESLKKQTDEGIQNRKKKLMNIGESNVTKNTQLKQLVKSLCDQVKFDEDFRNAKIWYEYNNDARKEEQIKKLMPGKSIEEIRQIMKVRESQNNPFFTTQGYESSIQKLVELYNTSENHWQSKLVHKFDFGSLENQGFTARQIDIEKKGHISLGDLVRFLNLQSGTFYRNRDLSLVFIRICKQHRSCSYTEVNFQWLKQTFCV